MIATSVLHLVHHGSQLETCAQHCLNQHLPAQASENEEEEELVNHHQSVHHKQKAISE